MVALALLMSQKLREMKPSKTLEWSFLVFFLIFVTKLKSGLHIGCNHGQDSGCNFADIELCGVWCVVCGVVLVSENMKITK